jgi:hypothetical protein
MPGLPHALPGAPARLHRSGYGNADRAVPVLRGIQRETVGRNPSGGCCKSAPQPSTGRELIMDEDERHRLTVHLKAMLDQMQLDAAHSIINWDVLQEHRETASDFQELVEGRRRHKDADGAPQPGSSSAPLALSRSYKIPAGGASPRPFCFTGPAVEADQIRRAVPQSGWLARAP